jgi:hypothetical protein
MVGSPVVSALPVISKTVTGPYALVAMFLKKLFGLHYKIIGGTHEVKADFPSRKSRVGGLIVGHGGLSAGHT